MKKIISFLIIILIQTFNLKAEDFKLDQIISGFDTPWSLTFKNQNEILVTENCYEPVANFLNYHLLRFGIKSTYYNSDVQSISKLINNNTKVI